LEERKFMIILFLFLVIRLLKMDGLLYVFYDLFVISFEVCDTVPKKMV
jgi:hypothetical protein